MKRWMPSTERRKQHRHADNHSHRRSWQRCRTSIHATRRSGLLVQCRRQPRLWRQEKHELNRKRVVSGKSVSVRVGRGVRRIINKTKNKKGIKYTIRTNKKS